MDKRSTRHGESCPFCGLSETQVHRFGVCQWSSRIWRASTLARCFECRLTDDCLEWFSIVKSRFPVDELERWCILLWFLWKERNAHLFNGFRQREDEVASGAIQYLANYQEVQDRSTDSAPTNWPTKWVKPPLGTVKINTDASIQNAEGMGAGVVIRDDEGRFCLASVVKYPGDWRPELAEAASMEFGINVAHEYNFRNIIVESDSLLVVQGLRNTTTDATELGIYYKSIRQLLGEFDNGSWCFCRREANMSAHIMAHSRANWHDRIVWEDRPPIFLVDQLRLDDVIIVRST